MKIFIPILTAVFIFILSAGAGAETINTRKSGSGSAGTAEMIQSQIDSINISQMVQEQIDAARKKSAAAKTAAQPNREIKKTAYPKKSEAGIWPDFINSIPFTNGTFIKISVILIFSFIVFGAIFFRRLFTNKSTFKNKGGVSDLKKNISLIREEKPLKVKDKNKLRQVRAKLIQNYSSAKMTNESISKTAKNLKISQGELLLAERIKLHKMAGEYAGKK